MLASLLSIKRVCTPPFFQTSARSLSASTRTLLNCPFDDRDGVKDLDGKWCKASKMWYVPRELKLESFKSWLHPPSFYGLPDIQSSNLKSGSVAVLDCPFDEKERVKAAGARWSLALKHWSVPPDADLLPFIRWLNYESLPVPVGMKASDRFELFYLEEAFRLNAEMVEGSQITAKKGEALWLKLKKAEEVQGVDSAAARVGMFVKEKDAKRAAKIVFTVLKTLSEVRCDPEKQAKLLVKTLSKRRVEGVCDKTGVVLRPGEGWYHRIPSQTFSHGNEDIFDIIDVSSDVPDIDLQCFVHIEEASDLGDDEARYELEHGKKGLCQSCGKRLVSVGHERAGGGSRRDWDSRLYHKECWKSKISE